MTNEIRVGTWNACNAFGDRRLAGALRVVGRMDADVLAIPEMADREGGTRRGYEQERNQKIAELLGRKGYEGSITDYTPDKGQRNAHYMSLWSRVGGKVEKRLHGNRNSLRLNLPLRDQNLIIYGLHQDDRYPRERVSAARSLLEALEPIKARPTEAILLGDFNEMYPDDPKGLVPRAVGRLINGLEVDNYYDPSKRMQKLWGKIIRVCRMAGGQALSEFAAAGFHDADPLQQPTIGSGLTAYTLDHILGSSGVTFKDFRVHGGALRGTDQRLYDHTPISTTVCWEDIKL